MDHLMTGKRHLLVRDIGAAVASFELACKFLSEQYGETGGECAEAYLYYGKALLEMARLESGVLGDALNADDIPESEGSQDNEESQDEGEISQDEEKDDEKIEKSKEEKEAGDTQELLEDENNEEPSSLQLAWEMLELAKMIFTKKIEQTKDDATALSDYENMICETFLTLGEVSLENENYSQAVEDLTACLKKQQETLPADSRCIAETHYQLGVAQAYQCSFEEAQQALNDAIKVLSSRIDNLKAEHENTDGNETNDVYHNRQREIAELEQLLPEIKEKIQDTDFLKKEIIRKMKEQAGLTNGAGCSGEPSKPTSSIAVKRRSDWI